MTVKLQSLWNSLVGRTQVAEIAPPAQSPAPALTTITDPIDIAPNDALIPFFLGAPGVVEMDKLAIDSPAVRAMKAAGVKLTIPLVSQGELVGVINMGPRLSEQEYSTDDRRLLANLATQAAPALRVAQLARQQQAEAAERERIDQELRVARLIQQTLLPKEVPSLEGWTITVHYQPARAVGGDFYDFLYFPDGRVGLIIGDVTDKGVPAAMVMATTRTMLRAAAENLETPGQVLERVNDVLHPDIPPKMFVTCLYALLDPATGRMVYANAGHDLPYLRRASGVEELRATGMPLGLMPGMQYEEKEVQLEPGDRTLFYSDGLVEAHSPTRDMFGFPRLQSLLATHGAGANLIKFLLDQLAAFTGADWEQEDDVTFLVLERSATEINADRPDESQTLIEFSVESAPGNERAAMEKVAAAVAELGLAPARLEKLKTAVAESTMNAMEHGNKYAADKVVQIRVTTANSALAVHITDQGGGQEIAAAEMPDLDAKLAGEQSPRGWGLFLIKNMVDEMHVHDDGVHHTIELIMSLEGGKHDATN